MPDRRHENKILKLPTLISHYYLYTYIQSYIDTF